MVFQVHTQNSIGHLEVQKKKKSMGHVENCQEFIRMNQQVQLENDKT